MSLECAESLVWLAVLERWEGDYEESRAHNRRALVIVDELHREFGPIEECTDKSHVDLHDLKAFCLHGLASILLGTGETEEAIKHEQEAIGIREKNIGPDHPALLFNLSALTNIYLRESDYGQAKATAKRGLEIAERGLGPDHPLLEHPLRSLAVATLREGDIETAEQVLTRLLEIQNRTLPDGDFKLADTYLMKGRVCQLRGDFEGARSHYIRSLEIYERHDLADSVNAETARGWLQEVEAELLKQRVGEGDDR
jgi:tetratricopeptide (TPR) repeat protein